MGFYEGLGPKVHFLSQSGLTMGFNEGGLRPWKVHFLGFRTPPPKIESGYGPDSLETDLIEQMSN